MTEPLRAADAVLRDRPELSRYELLVDGELAGFADYHVQPDLVTVLHTEVHRAFAGRGLGSTFVALMLEDIRKRDAKVLPVCPFVRAYLQRHAEARDLVWKP